jgi:hypothetical protein
MNLNFGGRSLITGGTSGTGAETAPPEFEAFEIK